MSRRGLYGDVVEEMDAQLGRLLDVVRGEGLAGRTLVFFSSDNGPWLTQKLAGGSAGPLREGKGSTWEGGMRVPGIAWGPGLVRPGVTGEIACMMDLFPTGLALAGAELTKDRVIDGRDLRDLLRGQGKGRDVFFYYRGTRLYAVRKGPFKAHYVTRSGYGKDAPVEHDPPLLFHLGHDPGERFDVAKDHLDVLANLAREKERHLAGLVPGKLQLEERLKPPPANRDNLVR
jgi:arylsulfatase A-like enzyme